MPTSTLSASAKGATLLILLQVGGRAVTFALNQILLRYLSPDTLGVAAQLELYSITVLYFARESLRVGLQRRPESLQAAVNISYLAIVSGIVATIGLGAVYLRKQPQGVAYFSEALQINGLAVVIELLHEPSFVIAQQRMRYKLRAGAETIATLVRCFATSLLAIWASRTGKQLGVLPFSIGQLGYSFTVLTVYVFGVRSELSIAGTSILPQRLKDAPKGSHIIFSYLSRPLCKLISSLFVQSTVKYVLTQGDAIIIASLASLSEQGAYALASNYGGLIARMFFQPIEESSRSYFASASAPAPSGQGSDKTTKSQVKVVLQDIMKLYSIISLIAVTIGPVMAPLLLKLVAGSRWADTGAGDVLASYCYYIPFLAFNGITEAFVAAVADEKELQVQTKYMTAFFTGFAASAYFFIRVMAMGAKGLVYANCVNMFLRIFWNTRFISRYFKRRSMNFNYKSTLPSTWTLATAAIIPSALAAWSKASRESALSMELLRTGVLSVGFSIALLVLERHYIIHIFELLRNPTELKKK